MNVMAKDKETQSRQVAPRYSDPLGTLRSEMDRLFDSFMGGLPTFPSMFGSGGSRGFALTPSMDIKETDKEIVVETELPGLDEKDISLSVQNGVLTIQGEKKLDYDEEKENYHVMERRYGSFQRSLRLPDTVDDNKIDARFDNGVLKVTLPKRPELAGGQRKIEVKKSRS
jgi:HSP20 family protein